MGRVYLATNKTNGKMYVGKTTKTLEARKKGHQKGARYGQGCFKSAIRKYGIDGFTCEELFVSDSEISLNLKEVEYIRDLNTKSPNGYNLTDGGEGLSNPPEEVRLKMRMAMLGKPKSEVHKANLKIAFKDRKMPEGFGETQRVLMTGRKRSAETKQKMSESSKGRRLSEETRAKLSRAHTGKTLSAETRKKMSLARMGNPGNRGKKLTEEHRRNLSIARTGTKRTEETKAKMSASIKKALADRKARLADQAAVNRNSYDRNRKGGP